MNRLLLSVLFLSVALSAEAARPRPALKPLAPNPFIDVGAEQALSDVVSYVAGDGASAPRVAVGPAQSLVVWRNNQAVRIGASGELLDVTPIPVLPAAPYQSTAWDAVWDGSRYIVAATAYTDAGDGIFNLVYLSTAGRVESIRKLDVPGIGFRSIRLAYSDGELALLYDTDDAIDMSDLVRGLLVSSDGVVTHRFNLGTTGRSLLDPSFDIVASPTGYLALWGDQAALISRGTGAVTPAALPLVNVATSAAWNGNAFFVVATSASGVYGFELTGANSSGPLVAIHSSPFGARHPAVGYADEFYRVLWKEAANASEPYGGVSFDLFTAAVARTGTVVGAGRLDIGPDSTDHYAFDVDTPAVGTRDGSMVVVWTRQLGTSITNFRNAYTAVLQGDEIPSADVFASRAQLLTRAASTETLFSLVPQQSEVRALLGSYDQRFTPRINVVEVGRDGRTAPVALSAQISNAHGVVAAFNGVDTTLVWSQADASNVLTVWAGEMDRNGQVVSRFPLPISGGTASPTLVCGPSDCAVAFSPQRFFENEIGYLQRIAPNGAPLYAAVRPPGPFFVAPLGNDYLVVMRFVSGISNATTFARLVEGKLTDVTYLFHESTYDVAFAISRGNECLVAVRREDPDIPNAETDFFRIDVAGNVVGTSKLALPPGTQQVWDGRNWLIAWTQLSASDIVAARIAPDLSHVDVVTLVGAASQPILVNLVSIGNGTSALAYYHRDFAPKYGGAGRMFLRWLDDRP
jgi:hypothetical protein